jgi:predicted RNase H-like HicB family nuclease
MKVYSTVIAHCPQTGLFVGFIPSFPGAHSQGETLDEVKHKLGEVITMLLEDGEPIMEPEFVGVQYRALVVHASKLP